MLNIRRSVVGTLVIAAVLSFGCSHVLGAETKTARGIRRDAAKLREKPELGFAPLPIKFGETVGLVVHFNQGESLNRLADLKNLGVKWVRDEEGWAGVEKVKGEYVWPEKRKERLKFYAENGIGVIFALTYAANKNVYPDDPYNPEGFGGYAVAAAKLHKEYGVPVVLEIFNEPHNFGVRKKYGGKSIGSKDCPWIDHYIKMANEAVRQVKAFDSDIKLITDEDIWSCHYWYLEGNLDKRIDGFAIHPYTFHGYTPGPEVSHYGGVYEPWTISDEDRSSRSFMRRLRAQYMEKIGRPVEMYITEWGHRIGGKVLFEGKKDKVSEDLAAAFLPRMYINGAAAGSRVTCWHVSQDMGDGPYGLIRNDQVKRKSYYALKTMVEQLGDYQMVKQIAGADNSTTGIQAYLFEGDAGYKLVAWNIEGPVKALFEPGYTLRPRVVDLFGKSVNFGYSKDGPPILNLGRAPIYIEGIGAECSLEEVEMAAVLIDDFSTDEWRLSLGREFPGAKGGKKLSEAEFVSAPSAMCVDYDLTAGGRYVRIERSISIPEKVKAISFQAKITAENSVFALLIDAKGEHHRSGTVALKKTDEWQEMTFAVNKKSFSQHWGGGEIGKGKIDFPVKKMWIAPHLNDKKAKAEGKAGQKGTLYVDDLTVYTRD